MGLDDFMDDDSGGTTTTRTQQTQETEEKKISDAFKTVGSGKYMKVFDTEEDWEETAEFLETEMDMNPQQVLNMPADQRHQILHKAILGRNGLTDTNFYRIRKCIVCDYEFVFPKDWDFEEYKNEPACPEHTITEVQEAYEEINKDNKEKVEAV